MIKKIFLPGEEWVYYKVYINEALADIILVNYIDRIAKIAIKSNIVDKWFYIRYYDPNPHLRIRFHLKDSTQLMGLINIFNLTLRPIIKNGLINNTSINIYEREIDRYGYNKIIDFETLFSIDSVLTTDFLKSNPSETDKILESISKAYYFCSKIIMDKTNQLDFVHSMVISYLKEFNISKPVNINKKYRILRDRLHEIGIRKMDFDNKFRIDVNLFNDKTKRNSFLSSLTHMCINRLFSTKQREYETITYIYLEKYLKSLKKMNKM